MIYNFLKGSNYNKLNQKNNYLNKCISEKINHNQLVLKYEAFLTQKQYNLKSMKNDIKQLFFEINIVLYLVIYQMFLKRLLRIHF